MAYLNKVLLSMLIAPGFYKGAWIHFPLHLLKVDSQRPPRTAGLQLLQLGCYIWKLAEVGLGGGSDLT